MVRLETIVNRLLGMQMSIYEMRDEKILKMLDTFLKHGRYGLNLTEAAIELYPQYIDNKKYRKPFKHNSLFYKAMKKQGAIRLLDACWEWERSCHVGNEYYSTKIELIEKYFNHFMEEIKTKTKNDYIAHLALPLDSWTDLIEGANMPVLYNRSEFVLKYNIDIKETADIVSKDTLYFLLTGNRKKDDCVGDKVYIKYSYKWITLYLNLLNIAVGKPYLAILKVASNGEVKTLAVPTMSDRQLKKCVTLYNQNRKKLLQGENLKNELTEVFEDEKITKILNAKEEVYVDNPDFVTDNFFDEDKIVEDEIHFNIVEYVKEVMPEDEGWLGLTIEEWASIAWKDNIIVEKDSSVENMKDRLSAFYIDFIRVLNKVLYLYGIFGVRYFLEVARSNSPFRNRLVCYNQSYNDILVIMESEMRWFNKQFIMF